jgi:phosphohistidine phosphatase
LNLYVIRHAEAVSLGGEIKSDRDRTLSERGKSDATMMARLLAQIDIDIKAIVTSPFVRAVETGEIFGRELKRDAGTSRQLEPGFSPRLLAEEILSLSSSAGVAAIGHQPDMSMFISYLISPAHAATVAMETCAIACVHLQSTGQGQLRWLLTPELVKKLNISL